MIRTKPAHTLHTEFQTQVRSRGVCRDVSAMVRVVRAVCERARVCVCGSPRTRSAVKHQSSGARTDYTPSLFKRTCVSVCVCVWRERGVVRSASYLSWALTHTPDFLTKQEFQPIIKTQAG